MSLKLTQYIIYAVNYEDSKDREICSGWVIIALTALKLSTTAKLKTGSPWK